MFFFASYDLPLQIPGQILSLCDHPNVLKLVATSLIPPCLILPLMGEHNLQDHLNNEVKRWGLTWVQRTQIAGDVFSALDYLHTPTGAKPAILHK